MIPESLIPNPQPRPPFSWPTRVYWEDTDAGGVVYHAQYLAFLERARTEWLRVHGYGQELLRTEHDLVFAVRAMRIDFRQPARLDDALSVTAALAECRRASLVIAQSIDRDGSRLLDAQVRVAALGAGDFRPRAIPDALYARLKSLQTRPVPDNSPETKIAE
ncbi:tol-pal system-associated acyl-CoA thioesterase [Luteimonas sp. SX5]|uniref:Tol-pal system-associated acyl-CoA thioesterase n=1 Tax=Luteimonas galliterrae TaxID=2940486 RepID=A0ABT0MI13_9GAMM|nr:tol-pal system-associated acyl-CoA thioesterase [Luteimonas galliterrae]MCL1634517.1 tol-pal system-associated acyl-CoA thioesterase [Luteimonas galliterrae]